MNNYIYLNNNIDIMNYENNVNEKIEIYNKLSNQDIIKKYQDDLLLLKKIINKILNIKNSTNILLNFNEEKIYELLYHNIAILYKKISKKKKFQLYNVNSYLSGFKYHENQLSFRETGTTSEYINEFSFLANKNVRQTKRTWKHFVNQTKRASHTILLFAIVRVMQVKQEVF
mgnify:CR=1 FL=1